MIWLKQFVSTDYWFSLFTISFSRPMFWVLLVVYILAIAAGGYFGRKVIRASSQERAQKFGWQKISSWGYSTGLVGLLLLFFRQQEVQFFSMRIWAWLWWLSCLIWGAFIVKYFVKELPKLKEEKAKRQEYQKYLPR